MLAVHAEKIEPQSAAAAAGSPPRLSGWWKLRLRWGLPCFACLRCAKICLQINYTVIRAVNQTLRSLFISMHNSVKARRRKTVQRGRRFQPPPESEGGNVWSQESARILILRAWQNDGDPIPLVLEIFCGVKRKLIAGWHDFWGNRSTCGAFVRKGGECAYTRTCERTIPCHF